MKRLLFSVFGMLLSISTTTAQEPYRVPKSQLTLESKLIAAHGHFILQDYPSAQKAYKELLLDYPDNAPAHYALARTYRLQKDFTLAEKHYKEALQIDPDNKWFYTSYAQCLEVQDKWGEAVLIYQDLHNKFPDNPDYLMQVSYAHLKDANSAQAIQALETYVEIYGYETTATSRLMDLYASNGSTKKAIELAQDHVQAKPHDKAIWYELAMLHLMQDDLKQAAPALQRVLDLDPDHGEAAIALADIQGSKGGSSEIGALLPVLANPAIEIDSKVARLMPYLEEFVIDQKQSLQDDLNLAIQTILDAHPHDPKAYAMAGDVWGQMDRKNEAIDSYQKTLELDPSVYLVWEQLVHLHKETYDYPSMKNTAVQALDLFPVKADLQFLHAQALYHLDLYPEALDALEEYKLVTLRDPEAQFRYHVLATHIHVHEDQIEGAKEHLASAKRIQSDNSIVVVLEAQIHMLQNDTKSATQLLSKVKDTNLSEYWVAQAQLASMEGTTGANIDQIEKVASKKNHPLIWEALGDAVLTTDASRAVDYWQRAVQLLPYEKISLQTKIEEHL